MIAAVALIVAACGGEKSAPQTMTVEQLQDPATCKQCHQTHYKEWSGSMHAYASKDPVFRAMDARGQRETASDPAGPLGGFCVKCHAPMAYLKDSNTVGADLDALPDSMQGITCYFCHQVKDVTDTHNNPLVLANDTTMRGEYNDPVPNKAHLGAYSELHDADGLHTSSGNGLESSKLCGSCHDIVVPAHFSGATHDVALERTYTEWQGSIFNQTGKLNSPNACGSVGCHTRPIDFTTKYNDVPIADAMINRDVKSRDIHPHGFPGIDTALTDFPEKDAQRKGVQTMLNSALFITVCATPLGDISVLIENSAVGHNTPSGASQDRRMWLEVRAYRAGEQVFASGVVPPGHSATELLDPASPLFDQTFPTFCTSAAQNPTERCSLLRDTPVDMNGNPASMFWKAADVPFTNRQTLTAAATSMQGVHTVGSYVSWLYRAGPKPLDRVTFTMHVQPIGIDVLEDLATSGDLEPSALRSDLDASDAGARRVAGGDGGVSSSLTFGDAIPVLNITPNGDTDDAGLVPSDAVTVDWKADTVASLGTPGPSINSAPSRCVSSAKVTR